MILMTVSNQDSQDEVFVFDKIRIIWYNEVNPEHIIVRKSQTRVN